jgi:hypothetical protein
MISDKGKLKLVGEVVELWQNNQLNASLAMARISLITTVQPPVTADQRAYAKKLEPTAKKLLGKRAKT